MRFNLFVIMVLLFSTASTRADSRQEISQADALHDAGKYAEAKRLFLDAAAGALNGRDKAELLWRASREALELGVLVERSGAPDTEILEICWEGERYADAAIQADPRNELGYFWKSANMGRRGQVKGMLNALFLVMPIHDLLLQALSLNPQRSDVYYVLGQMYRELPGWPLSFGSVDAAVSLGGKAVDLRMSQAPELPQAPDYDFYLELAITLHKRNWTAAMRASRQEIKRLAFPEAITPLVRGLLYEAAVLLERKSDREEAAQIVRWCIVEMEKRPTLTAGESDNLIKARELLERW